MIDKWLVNKKSHLKSHCCKYKDQRKPTMISKQENEDLKSHCCKYKDEILSMEVTDGKVHDGKVMPKLIEHVLKNNNNIKIKSILGDGSYDRNENFKYLKKMIRPMIKVRNSFIISPKNNKVRNREAKLLCCMIIVNRFLLTF
jgi:hypothetical protein